MPEVDHGQLPAGAAAKKHQGSGPKAVSSVASPQTKLYGIGLYRRAGGATVGWTVSIRRRGDHVNRCFLAKNFGGMDQALQAAIAFRDEVNQRFPPLTKREKCAVLRSNNTSGVPGVYLTTTGEWVARVFLGDGRRKTRRFSIRLLGEDEARRRAIQARAELLSLVRGHVLQHEEMREVHFPDPSTMPDVVITPHKDEPTPSPFEHPRRNKAPGVETANVKTVLKNGRTVITTYRVAVFKQPNGLPKRRYFSVAVYGEEEALRLAREQRQTWEREARQNKSKIREPIEKGTRPPTDARSSC